MTTWRSDRRWRFPWRTQPRAADGQLAANIADGVSVAMKKSPLAGREAYTLSPNNSPPCELTGRMR
jgi:hypothetical protein